MSDQFPLDPNESFDKISDGKPLTARQSRFVEEYVKDCNGAQAAIRAGYSEKAAKEQASRLLTNANIWNEIERQKLEISKKAMVDAVWIRSKLKSNVERAMQAEAVMDNEGNPIGVYKYSGTAANRALELLGKDLGMFTDRLEVSLTPGLKQLIQDLARLAIDCCDKDKRDILLSKLQDLKAKYDLSV